MFNVISIHDGTYMRYLFQDLKTELDKNNYGNIIISTAVLGNPSKMGLDTQAYYTD